MAEEASFSVGDAMLVAQATRDVLGMIRGTGGAPSDKRGRIKIGMRPGKTTSTITARLSDGTPGTGTVQLEDWDPATGKLVAGDSVGVKSKYFDEIPSGRPCDVYVWAGEVWIATQGCTAFP